MTQDTQCTSYHYSLDSPLVDSGAFLNGAKHWPSSSDQWSKSIIAKRQLNKQPVRTLANIGRKKEEESNWITAKNPDLCNKRRELRKKRFEPEGSEKYKEVNNNIKRCMKEAKEHWIGEQCSPRVCQVFRRVGRLSSVGGWIVSVKRPVLNSSSRLSGRQFLLHATHFSLFDRFAGGEFHLHAPC